MICSSCAWAGFRNQIGDTKMAQNLHDECKGCTCQHKIGIWLDKTFGWVKRSESEHFRA